MKLLMIILTVMFIASCGNDPISPAFPPPPSILEAEAVGDSSGVILTWTACSEETSFYEYEIYRSSFYNIPDNPELAVLLASTSEIHDTLLIDMSINWVDSSYYCIKNVDTEGRFNWSNIVQVNLLDSLDTFSCSEIQGQQSESPYIGQNVAVTGVVTTARGVFGPHLMVIADGSGGPWSGLAIRNYVFDYSRGDSLLILGRVDEIDGVTTMKRPMTIELIRANSQLPGVSSVSTSELASAADPERWEGVLVEVSEAVVTTTSTTGFLVDDCTGSCIIGDRSGYPYYPSSNDTLTITGIVLQDDYTWTLEPRDDDDLLINYAGLNASWGQAWKTCFEIQGQSSSSPYNGEVVTVFGIVSTASNDYPQMVGWGYGIPLYFKCSFLVDPFNGIKRGLLLAWEDEPWVLSRGDNVVITGYCSEDLLSGAEYWTDGWGPPGNTAVYVYDVINLGSAIPSPPAVNASEDWVTSEYYEGVLVSINNAVVTNLIASHRFDISYDMGSRSCKVYDYPFSAAVGDTIQQITGVVWFNTYTESFILRPRDEDDIIQ